MQLEKQRLKDEQEKRQMEERAKFVEKTKSLLVFEHIEEDKPRKSGGGGRVRIRNLTSG